MGSLDSNILLDFLSYFAALNMGIVNEDILGLKKREGERQKRMARSIKFSSHCVFCSRRIRIYLIQI